MFTTFLTAVLQVVSYCSGVLYFRSYVLIPSDDCDSLKIRCGGEPGWEERFSRTPG